MPRDASTLDCGIQYNERGCFCNDSFGRFHFLQVFGFCSERLRANRACIQPLFHLERAYTAFNSQSRIRGVFGFARSYGRVSSDYFRLRTPPDISVGATFSLLQPTSGLVPSIWRFFRFKLQPKKNVGLIEVAFVCFDLLGAGVDNAEELCVVWYDFHLGFTCEVFPMSSSWSR